MRVVAWPLVCVSCLVPLGCNLNLAFDSNRGNLLAQADLIALMNDVARTSVSSEFGTLSGVQDMGLSLTLASTRLSCAPDSTGNSRRNSLGVPLDLTYSWTAARCTTSSGPNERTFGGATRIQDLGGRFAVRVTHENLVGTVLSTGTRQRYELSGVVEIHATDATTATVVQRIFDRTETISTSGSGIITKIRNLTLSLVDTLGVPRTGTRTGSRPNLLSIEGTYVSVTESARRDSTHLKIRTVVPLQADLTCSSGYRAGEIRAAVSGVANDEITMTYRCQ